MRDVTMTGSAKKESSDAEKVEKFLTANPQVQVVIWQWVDVSGIVRNRVTSAAQFRRLVASGGFLNSAIIDLTMSTTGDVIDPILLEYFNIERKKIIPDISTLRVASHDACGIGNVAIVHTDLTLLDMDPRDTLRRLLKQAETEHGLRFLMGFELEICFFERNGDMTPAGTPLAGWCDASVSQRSAIWPLLNEILVAFSEAGIQTEQAHKETGSMQYEICLPPAPPLEAVDTYVFAREVVKNIAYKHGLIATFFPTPEADASAGQKSGQHIHLSVTKGGDDGSRPDAKWNPDEAMAGILSHISALTAIGMGLPDSYHRVGVGGIAAGAFIGWGDFNRDMPVRRLERNHWEIRVNDGTSNPYAMAAAIIGAALDKKPLTMKPVNKWIENMSAEERQELGLSRLLPQSLEEALGEFEADRDWLERVMGKNYVRWFLMLKRHDLEKLSKMEATKKRALMLTHF